MFQNSNPNKLPELQNLESKELLGFFEDILNRGLTLRFEVTGRSMSPFLVSGEILTTKKVPFALLHSGDLILYKTCDGFPILHRIIRKNFSGKKYFFQTKGDSLISMDEPVNGYDILGKVCTIEKKSASGKTQHIDMESLYWKIINYLLAKKSLLTSKAYLSIQQCPLYPSLRSIIKKKLV